MKRHYAPPIGVVSAAALPRLQQPSTRPQVVPTESPTVAAESPLDDCDLFGDNICLDVQAYPELV